MYAWVKFFHLAAIAAWFAGLMALPWIYGEHALARDTVGITRLRRIERTVYFGVMTPAAALAVLLGTWLMFFGFEGAWLHVKLTLTLIAVLLHLYCGTVLLTFIQGRNRHGRGYFRTLSQVPVLLLIAIVFLAAVKPF